MDTIATIGREVDSSCHIAGLDIYTAFTRPNILSFEINFKIKYLYIWTDNYIHCSIDSWVNSFLIDLSCEGVINFPIASLLLLLLCASTISQKLKPLPHCNFFSHYYFYQNYSEKMG